MMKKRWLVTFIGALCMGGFLACACSSDKEEVDPGEGNKEPGKEDVIVPSSEGMVDIALMYHGGSHRPRWYANEMKYYVFRDKDGKPEWMFDTFLFLEIYTTINGTDYDFGVGREGVHVPNKAEWNYLLSETFAPGRGPDAIESTIDSLVKKGYVPPCKRKAIFAIPNPIYGNKVWGKTTRVLDFTKPEDRIEAANWYINRVLEEWNKKNYKYLDFGGFYWLHETIEAQNKDDVVVKGVAASLAARKMDFCWIPYNWAEGVEKWKEFGFSLVYQQPNYFFVNENEQESKYWVLKRAVDFAKEQGIHMEMEFDDRAAQPLYRERFNAYIKEFQDGGIWDNDPSTAYYMGADCWMKMATSYDPSMKEMHKTMGDIIAKRQAKFTTIKK